MKKIALFLAIAMLLPVFLMCSCSGTKYEVVMEYNGIELTEDMYYYWLSTFKRNILSSYSDAYDNDEFWQAKYDETRTVEDYFTEIINQRIMNYLIAQSLYKENRLTLSSDVKNAIKDDINEKIEYYGSRGELNAELSNLMLNIDSLKEIYTWEEKHDAVYDYFFGAGGVEEISDAALQAYYEETYSRIKYIVFYTTKIQTDEDGNYVYDEEGYLVTEDMTEEELEAKMQKIDECYQKLADGASFDDMRKEYSEYDTSSYVNGFFVSANEVDVWGTDIVLGAAESKPGDIFRVEEESAVYLVLKCELTDLGNLTELDIEQLSNLSVYATRELYDKKFEELSKNVTVNSEVLSKYKLSEIKANPYYAI